MLFHILSFIVLGLCIWHYYVRHGKVAKLIDKIPGPVAYPIVGNVLTFLFSKKEEIVSVSEEINKKYYPIYRIWTPFWAVVNILSPDDAEIVLSSNKNMEKSTIYEFLRPWLGDGLLISKNAKWQNRRKILTPAFHFNVLQKYMDVLLQHGTKLVKSLKSAEKETTVDLVPFMTKHALSAMCEAAMGVSFDKLDPEIVEKYREAVFFMGEVVIHRLVRPWLLSNFVFDYLTPFGWQQRKALKILHGFSSKIIKERKEYHEKTGGKYLKEFSLTENSSESEEYASLGIKKKRLAMLDLLIAASWDGLIDERGIHEEIDTFIFEGHDTSAMALCYIIHILAEHMEVQEKARAEIDEVWNTCDGEFSMTEINKLHYLERCIRESLRLYPSVPLISRRTREDLQLKNYVLPAGTVNHIFIDNIHRDPNYWPEPNKFDPDRFLPDRILERHPYSYIPFSAGSRNCIGQRFAMMELKTFSAYILHNFKLTTTQKHEDFKRFPDLVYRPVGKIKVTFTAI